MTETSTRVRPDPRVTLPSAMRNGDIWPADTIAVFIGGSVARGWDNHLSDVDAYVVTAQPWHSATALAVPVKLAQPSIPMEWLDLQGVVYDIEYWTETQITEVLAKLGETDDEPDPRRLTRLGKDETHLLDRLGTAMTCSGAEWVARAQTTLAQSPYRALNIIRLFDLMDSRADDAVGQLQAGDLHSAVLSTRLAFDAAVDGLLCSYGEFGSSPKWRARRFATTSPVELDFEDYWAIETCRGLDPADPAGWVESTIRTCRRLTMTVNTR